MPIKTETSKQNKQTNTKLFLKKNNNNISKQTNTDTTAYQKLLHFYKPSKQPNII